MASAGAPSNLAMSPPKSVNESLWWDSFVVLFEELDAVPLPSDLPDHLAKTVKSNHGWWLDSLSRFKPPNQESRIALDSPRISIGSHHLCIRPELKAAALRVSTSLCLNEVQSYILVDRSLEHKKPIADIESQDFVHMMLLHYYLERQCLLKCIRRIFVQALYVNNGSSTDAVKPEALQLVDDGLESKLVSTLHDLFSSASSDRIEVHFTILWVEETLIEDNLVLDIIFLFYYDNFCTCKLEQWKVLFSLFKGMSSCSFDVGKLAVSVGARNSFSHAKAQLLLILIETLNLEHLLQMVHDEVPYRQGSVFSLSNIQEIDSAVSSLSGSGIVETGPLILAWAVFICLLLSLPEKGEYGVLMEIDHIGYVRQAFDASPFNYLLDILHSDTLRDSDGPVSGFLSILRTFVSAFIASYDVAHQTDDNILNVLVDVICQIYTGEESLSMQFWDRDSFVDSPIRSLLYMLEREYPFQSVKLVRLLSALCQGTWAAECVYNFLYKMSGISLPFEITAGLNFITHGMIECHRPLSIPGMEGLIIPSGTRGHILKVIDANVALVHWECEYSGILLLLLHLAHMSRPDDYKEIVITLKLLYQMVSFNKAVCLALLDIDKSLSTQDSHRNGQREQNVRVDVVKIICSLVFHLLKDVSNTDVVPICINILGEILKCAPCHVIDVALRSNLFRMEIDSSSSGMWLLSGELEKMLLADCKENVECFPLTISVLDFTIELVDKGAEDNLVAALVVFSLQYVLVNHMNWKSKLRYARWNLTLKALKVMSSCIKAIHASHKLGTEIRGILLYDSSIHNILCQIICVSAQALERPNMSLHFEFREVESLQLVLCSALDAVYSLLVFLLKEVISNVPAFFPTLLSSARKPVPVVTAAISLMSFQNSALQVSAVKVLSLLCFIASRVQQFSTENVSLVPDAMQIRELRSVAYGILDQEQSRSKDLLIPIFNLLTSAARYQPALAFILLTEEEVEVPLNTASEVKNQLAVAPITQLLNSKKTRSIDSILQYLTRSGVLTKSDPYLLLSVVNLLKALWEGGIQYKQILEKIKSSGNFWKNLSSILPTDAELPTTVKNFANDEIKCRGYRYKCQGAVLEVMAHELFLQAKLLHSETPAKKDSASFKGKNEVSEASSTLHLKDILSTWWGSSILENLIKLYSSSEYEYAVISRAKVAVCLCIVHLLAKLLFGNTGSLSVSLVEKIHAISNKLSGHPAFSALLAQYSSHGYSEEKELTRFLLIDLYNHLQGELEGREMVTGHFHALTQLMLDLEIFEANEGNNEMDIWPPDNNFHMFDIPLLRSEFGIGNWVYSEWKASKEVAERMFLHMHEANMMMLLACSKHVALKDLIVVISLYNRNTTPRIKSSSGTEISERHIDSSIRCLCKCLHSTGELLVKELKAPKDLIKLVSTHISTQSELLLVLSRILFGKHLQETNTRKLLPLCVLVVRTSGSVIKLLIDIRPSPTVLDEAVKLLLMLLLTYLESCHHMGNLTDKTDSEAKLFADVSLMSAVLLPILCEYIANTELCNLSVALVDLMLKSFLPCNTWLPILQKHLQMQVAVRKIQADDADLPVSVMLSFFLTMAHVKDGAEMLHSANIFSSLKVLFARLNSHDNLDDNDYSVIFSKDEKHGHLWGLGLAIVTSMIYSLGDDVSSTEVVDSAIHYFFAEKAYILTRYLSIANKHRKTSLTDLRVTEQTLMLICVLAKHQVSWRKGMKEFESEVRETSIHLLAFISKGGLRSGELPNGTRPPFCSPIHQEELELTERPSFVSSRRGWFDPLQLGIKDRTRFFDTVAVQMYKVALVVLKFLCVQARVAARRAQEMEFVDLAHFPELPMPEILHGLEDQAMAIVTEVCEGSRSGTLDAESEVVCLLLLQIFEKSLYLELCVSRSCGIRPVLGRIEDFSKEVKRLVQAVERHTNLTAWVRSLMQIITVLYPGLFDGLSQRAT